MSKTALLEQETVGQDDELKRFPIRTLAERTGVGTSTLRAWERRYGLLKPERTPKGHRLYCNQDIMKIRRVLTLLEEGISLPNIAKRLSGSLEMPETTTSGPDLQGIWHEYYLSTLRAVAEFSTERVEAIYSEACALYPFEMVTERLLEPVLRELGEGWQKKSSGIAQEHFYSSWVRNRLGAQFHHAQSQARGARLVCGCVPGNFHEIGLMLFCLSTMARGYRPLYLGSDMVINQLLEVAEKSEAKGILLSARQPLEQETRATLIGLVENASVPVFLGGVTDQKTLTLFEAAGGVLLGSAIGVGLKVLSSHIAPYTLKNRGKATFDDKAL